VLYALPQVAEYLGVSVRTVKRLIASGKLTGTKYGRETRVLQENLEAFTRAATCQTRKTEPETSSSSQGAGGGSNTSVGITRPLDRRMVFQLAQQTSRKQGKSYTSMLSDTQTQLQERTRN
jgi:excisionase family DNA binding protein